MALNENAKKWVEALRSGKYQQGKGQLYKDGAYCCLGVAANIFGYPCGDKKYLHDEVMQLLGLNNFAGSFEGTSLAYVNDNSGKTFAEIADIIESEPEGLFVAPVATTQS